ncbi:hypothetical protein RhiirC2_809678 [Rhizophagus irregularis]|uniref:Uncharacterized protein n=1 Tax=Rhizophagus irregularis TaxID=588596 RepID=A0A2N1NTY8_9GLOM|nr:hypothetical protein RhiirC2_809678 [Rhizophagus irregularis]
MEHLSFTYIASQWTDTDSIISSYRKICKQLAICQEKLREEREKKGQKKLSKCSQKAAQQSLQSQHEENNNVLNFSNKLKLQKEVSALHAEEKHLIRIKNALWRSMGPSFCARKENKLVSSKSLECSSPYQRKDGQQKKCLTNATQTHSSYVPRYNRSLQNRRIQRKIRHASTYQGKTQMIPSQPISLMGLISDYARYLTPILIQTIQNS